MGRDTGYFDWFIAIFLLVLCGFGLFLLLTIDAKLFVSQLGYLVVAIGIFFAVSRIDPYVFWWGAPIGYVISCVILIVSFLGPEIRGATRWIVVGGVQFQPSELVKPFILLAFARFYSWWPPQKIQYVFVHCVLLLLVGLPIFLQPDLGTTIVYVGSWVSMLLAAGFSPIIFICGIGTLVVSLPYAWHLLAAYQKSRILTFLDPALDPRGAGYNALQAMIAVGSGQLIGRGLGRGTQSHLRFLPEFHTDFIFATLVEELGFIGGALLILGYLFLLYRIVVPYFKRDNDNYFRFLYAMGLSAMILLQVGINAGMNMGILPITGITLPFVSYGGSSLLSFAISFGILFSLSRLPSDSQTIAKGASA